MSHAVVAQHLSESSLRCDTHLVFAQAEIILWTGLYAHGAGSIDWGPPLSWTVSVPRAVQGALGPRC